ncbi:asparagine synthase-related protein [Haloarchaeobius sp. DFWS5]|uniref:asparagine synthase-related protein n=1 Tax=Haloarchaeobius sp. DFWS5 TaxID=3446114 RepID=UPI003EBC01FB
MPGLSAIAGAVVDETVEQALSSVCFTDRYERTTRLDTGGLRVAETSYESYPVRSFEIDGYRVFFEGYLYGVEDTAAAVADVLPSLVADRHRAVAEWIAARDGEFVIAVVDPESETLWVCNDQFARLPLFHARVGETHIVSRELGFVRELARQTDDGFTIDRLGTAQLLLFGYPLGTRTLFDGVTMLPPGGVLRIDGSREVERVQQFDLGGDRHAEKDRETNAKALESRFVEACEARAAAGGQNIVALSGGMDSRTALAGYEAADGVAFAATSSPPHRAERGEARVASELADRVGVDWRWYASDPTNRHHEELLAMAQGMNSLANAAGLDFCESVAHEHPGATLVTGDGGDKALPDLTPAHSLDSKTDLVDTLLRSQHRLSVEDAAGIAGISPNRLVDSVEARIDSYPESALEDRYVHFLVRERGINWLNHGEERTRNHLWATTPFYAPDFFFYAMQCPPDQKSRRDLYRSFLRELSDEAVAVEYADFGASIDSLEFRVKQTAYDALDRFPRVKTTVVDLFRTLERTESDVSAEIRQLTDADDGDQFTPAAVRRTVRDGNYSDSALYTLYTVLAARHGALADRQPKFA